MMQGTMELLGKIITNILTALYEPFGFSLLLSFLAMFFYLYAYEPGEAGKYGSEARNGAIVVRLKEGYTLNNIFDTPTLATVTVTPLGYKKPEAFYAPKYETSAAKADNKPDLRTTVYWDPCVKPDRNGKISLTFYTADKATVYDVILEGITDNGSICRATTTIDRTR